MYTCAKGFSLIFLKGRKNKLVSIKPLLLVLMFRAFWLIVLTHLQIRQIHEEIQQSEVLFVFSIVPGENSHMANQMMFFDGQIHFSG